MIRRAPIEIQVNKLLATIGTKIINDCRHEDFEALSKVLESYASAVRLIKTTLPRITDCALMSHGLASGFSPTSPEGKEASNLERELNEIAAELRKEGKA